MKNLNQGQSKNQILLFQMENWLSKNDNRLEFHPNCPHVVFFSSFFGIFEIKLKRNNKNQVLYVLTQSQKNFKLHLYFQFYFLTFVSIRLKPNPPTPSSIPTSARGGSTLHQPIPHHKHPRLVWVLVFDWP